MEPRSKPNWWIPFSFVPSMIVALLVESQFHYPVQVHEIVDVGIVIATFGLIAGWVHVNQGPLEEELDAPETWEMDIVEPTAPRARASEPTETISEVRSMPKAPTGRAYAGRGEWTVGSHLERRN